MITKLNISICEILTKGTNGGVESVVMNYCRQLKDSFHFVIMIENESKLINRETVSDIGGELVIIPPYKKLFEYNRFMYKYFKSHPEIGIVQANLSTMSFLALREAKRAGIKVRIAESHSTGSRKEPVKSLLKQIFRHTTKHYLTDRFACSYKAGEFQFGKKAMDRNEVFIASNGVDIDRFLFNEANRATTRAQLGIKDSDFVIGHIGRFVPQKNHKFIVSISKDIFREIPNAKFLLLGAGPLLNEIKEEVNSLGLSENFVFAGTKANTAPYYSAMDCFVLPSLYEGLPVVSIEAQANGLPLIISECITKEARLLDTTQYLPIDSAAIWAREIKNISRARYGRYVDPEKLQAFDIAKDAQNLAAKYKELIEANGN